MSGGPKNSVPNQVNSQAVYDDVFWINITQWGIGDSAIRCECITEHEAVISRIKDIAPDLVVFEEYYYIEFCKIGRYLQKANVPYIIVPRGSMTRKAQQLKWYKKKPANLLFFGRFARKALAVEYLTAVEKENSGSRWNKNAIIVPNGTRLSKVHAAPSFTKEKIRGVFIGRIELFHKGLDVFIEICGTLKPLLEQKNCVIDLYGPCRKETKEKLNEWIKRFSLEDTVSIHSEIHGKEKEEVLANSDFFILTSRFEGLPMGLLEALSYGLPSLVTDETNIGRAVDEAHAGFSSAFDKTAIMRNLESLLTLSEEKALQMSRNAILFAQKYDWDSIAESAHKDYLRLLSR